MQKVSAACMNCYTRRSPGVRNNIIIISVAIASLPVLALALTSTYFSEEMARRLDKRMVLCKE
jgi:hypothetical protein